MPMLILMRSHTLTMFFIQANAIHLLRANPLFPHWQNLAPNQNQNPAQIAQTARQQIQHSINRLEDWAGYEYNLNGINVPKQMHLGYFAHQLPHGANVPLYLAAQPMQHQNLW